MFSLISFVKRVQKGSNPPQVEKKSDPIQFGILGAARIAPDALVKPARYHDDVRVVAVAARSKQRADEFGKTWNVPSTYGGDNGYQELIDDPEVHVVYNALPNALHFEWTMKALAAGKHVLCEKPIASNEEETRKMFELAESKKLILLEAWQVRFHPAIQRVKQIIDEGSLGKMVSMSSDLGVWNDVFFVKNDIRFDYSLGGGGLMDMGPYPISCMRYLASSNPTVDSAKTIIRSENIDRLIDAKLTFPPSLPATIKTDSAMEGWGPFKLFPQWIKMVLRVDCEDGAIEIRNFVLPHVWHSITVIPKKGKSWVEKAYKPKEGLGEEWWSAYRYQLEAFVDKVRGREPQAWRSAEDSIDTMRIIDTMYTMSGLPLRPTSAYTP
ncbi:hypothetical protein SERLA73DRAFT_148399 [Serpula lacrymans var. lacrymans S7.3]|uniref:D-xylose 1-dehydrogenase (NADP(+), D-xylono-1,5-lactone-forming) n=1 Tax=Serpula lacrymans var. lacrymans (strain S7.3) TaxID=936435 RepID=F8QJD1_SERL3|nr:hypothetical protein SERLA73DRAFT_148399 [Serpula lacrymans var. lacrymans S7.3]